MIGIKRVFYSALVATLVVACGGGGNSGEDEGGGGEVVVIGDGGGPIPPPEVIEVEPPIASGDFILGISGGFNEEWDATLNSNLQPRLNYVNGIVALPQDMPVSLQDCGIANAFYVPRQPNLQTGEIIEPIIVMCWELYFQMLANFDQTWPEDPDTAFLVSIGAYTHVLYHEIGHALDDQLELPIVGNSESAADAIATVFSVQSGEGINVISAALLFDTEEDGSFAAVHAGGADRAGDLFCWALGGDPALAEFFTELTQVFVLSGRDCAGEYEAQLSAVSAWLPNIAGPVGLAADRTAAKLSSMSESMTDSLRDAANSSPTITRIKSDI